MAQIIRKAVALAVALPLLASCAAMRDNMQGPMQPQSIAGPCQVKRFFLLGLRSVPAEITVSNTGATCTFTLINPALDAVVDAALVTGLPAHGQARAERINGSRQAAVSYTPAPGYTGPDRFSITLEPNAVGITVNVTVGPAP